MIFLDFDGVLHPVHCSQEDYFCRLPLLGEVLAEADVGIVISSSWRFHFSRDEILKRFPLPLRKLIVGFTGDACIGRYARYNEIKRYADLNSVRNWLAIDDSGFEFPGECDRLILCNGATGVTQKEVDALSDRLVRVS